MDQIEQGDRLQAGNNGIMIAAGVPLICLCIGFGVVFTSRQPSPKAKVFTSISCVMMMVMAMYGCAYAGIVHAKLSGDAKFIPGYVTLADGIILAVSSGGGILGMAFFCKSASQAINTNPRNLVACILVAIYIEAIPLYGFIIGLTHFATANKKQLDIAAGTSVEFAFGEIAASIGSIVGTTVCGIAIAEASLEADGPIQIRWIIPIVFNGVTAIYGLIGAVIAGGKIPEVGSTALGGICYLVSSAGLAFVGYKSVMTMAGDLALLSDEGRERAGVMFKRMTMMLIGCQSIGLVGLIITVITLSGLDTHPSTSQQFCLDHGNYYDDGSCYDDTQQIILAEEPTQHWAFAAAFLALVLPTVAVLLRSKHNRSIQEPLLA